MSNRKKLGLMKKSETTWYAKNEKVTALNSAFTNIALAYIAATLAI
ncbi:hypothetical protein SAMN05216537_102224 [Lachnospira multipara]|uniref:Uncharacterized protein n=1 Tax=Lachnospira multipara TaxID=28051 RepID=A0A1H5SGH4_9FIRM|nr:hypothetical protein SAMN05216537_102224 [Lachnospira multipara]